MQPNETLPLVQHLTEPVVKVVKPMSFLFFRTKARINELGSLVGVVARELYKDAVMCDMEVTGPVYWNYFDFDGDPSKSFILEISLPVAELLREYPGRFKLKRTDLFHCVSLQHEGSWYDIPGVYRQLAEYMKANSLQPGNENREIYLNIDFIHPDANLTEIQMGISSPCR